MGVQSVILGAKVPSFRLKNQNGEWIALKDILSAGPTLVVFYPGDFTPVCTKQLCNYRDNFPKFRELGVQVVGISGNPPEAHAEFAKQYDFPFMLLSDPGKVVAKEFGCTSLFMFGGISRAVFVIGKDGTALFRYVEPTVLTRRKADELVNILKDLKTQGAL